jgi:regulator of sigma E protease
MVGVLILVHEFGHFLMARALGIGVETFCLGFGPMLIKKQLGQTLYAVALVPLGGFVKLVGESDQEEVSPELLSRSFAQRPVFHRLLVVLGGPLFNILFALWCLSALGLGVPKGLPRLLVRCSKGLLRWPRAFGQAIGFFA